MTTTAEKGLRGIITLSDNPESIDVIQIIARAINQTSVYAEVVDSFSSIPAAVRFLQAMSLVAGAAKGGSVGAVKITASDALSVLLENQAA